MNNPLALDKYKSLLTENVKQAQSYFDACVSLMDDDLRDQVHNDLAPCTQLEFLERYSELHFAKYNDTFVCN